MSNKLICILILMTVLTVSCKETLCGEIQLGNKFVVALEQKRNQIIFCTTNDYCCNSGFNAVPIGLTDYAYDDKWIIAKTVKDGFWIIDKDFDINLDNCEKENCDEILKSHIQGNLTDERFKELTSRRNIDFEFINVE